MGIQGWQARRQVGSRRTGRKCAVEGTWTEPPVGCGPTSWAPRVRPNGRCLGRLFSVGRALRGTIPAVRFAAFAHLTGSSLTLLDPSNPRILGGERAATGRQATSIITSTHTHSLTLTSPALGPYRDDMRKPPRLIADACQAQLLTSLVGGDAMPRSDLDPQRQLIQAPRPV